MEEFKLYSISDEYVEWLRENFRPIGQNVLIETAFSP